MPAIPLRILVRDEPSTTAVVEEELAASFPLKRDSLIRAMWLRHKPELGTLVLTVHHVIGDGISGAFLMRDVSSAAAGTLDLPFRALDTVKPLEASFPRRQ